MLEGKVLDIAHISFLDMIKVMITMNGAAAAKGTLIRNAIKTAEKISEVDYPTFDVFLAAIENSSNPITQVEGKVTHMGGYIFGLQNCPFAPSIEHYTKLFEKLPDDYADFTKEFNKPSKVTDIYRVGEGAGVSPFCSVHQPMRSAIAERIKIDGKKIKIYQIGCKADSGQKGFAEKWMAETGITQDIVDKVLDNNMCCYYMKILD